MDELILEPYSVVQSWTVPGAQVPWDALLSDYLQGLALRCEQEAGNFLGHIKCLAVFGEDLYLRLSVIDPRRPAGVEGNVPSTQNTIELTLNVIVYGLKHAVVEQITEATAAEIAAQWNGEVSSQKSHHH